MPGCLTRCTTYRTDTINNAWLDIRYHFGPRVNIDSERHTTDIAEWTEWAINSGISITDVDKFGKWLIWKCSNGTNNYGQLPSRKRGHEGISCIPCPFDSNNYDEMRSEAWLGYLPTTLSDHTNFYMKVAYHGSWGFQCTYSGCSYLLEHGHPYFHV